MVVKKGRVRAGRFFSSKIIDENSMIILLLRKKKSSMCDVISVDLESTSRRSGFTFSGFDM
jgi:hypothetical protein